jgi:pentatricopeptide repeat protein
MERLANVLDLQGMRQQAAEMRVRCAIEDMFRKGDQESLLNVRSIALELFRAGDYARAEEIYRRLLERRFEPSSTCCHLARVLTMCDREQEARSALTQGWKMRVGALPYVSARILFFRLVFALLDGEDGRQQLECIKHLLKQVNVHHIWIMEPVITHLERRLTADKIELLQALVAALSERKNLPMLEALDQWRKPNSRTGAVC